MHKRLAALTHFSSFCSFKQNQTSWNNEDILSYFVAKFVPAMLVSASRTSKVINAWVEVFNKSKCGKFSSK